MRVTIECHADSDVLGLVKFVWEPATSKTVKILRAHDLAEVGGASKPTFEQTNTMEMEIGEFFLPTLEVFQLRCEEWIRDEEEAERGDE